MATDGVKRWEGNGLKKISGGSYKVADEYTRFHSRSSLTLPMDLTLFGS
jgi:hypothetical protein